MNLLAEGHEFLSLGALAVSPDANLLRLFDRRYRVSRVHAAGEGSSQRATAVRADRKTRSVAWANDSATLFYVQEDVRETRLAACTAMRSASAEDALVFEEGDARFSIGVQRSRSRGWIFLGSHSATTSEVYCIPADQPRRRATL